MIELHASTLLLPPLPTEFAHHSDRFINHCVCNIKRGTETDRVLTRTKSQDAEIEEAVPKLFARFRVGQIEGEKQSTATRSGNQRLLTLQLAQLLEEICAYLRGVLHKMLLLDNAQVMRRAHHVGEISAPGGIQTAG